MGIANKDKNTSLNIKKRGQKLRYWAALSLLRGIMSSPFTALTMLESRIQKRELKVEDLQGNEQSRDESGIQMEGIQNSNIDSDISIDNTENPEMESAFDFNNDNIPASISEVEWTQAEIKKLKELTQKLKEISGIEIVEDDEELDIKKSKRKKINPQTIKSDNKINKCIEITEDLIKNHFNPIIFCRYINTAQYAGQILSEKFSGSKVQIEIITSDESDEVRRERINNIREDIPRIMIATDCLSEGINLQDKFNAVIHYDLPWNPNRLEQREGRIDRFGQNSEKVKAITLYSKDNFIDGIILGVLIRKIVEVKKELGISLPFPEENKAVLDSIINAWITKAEKRKRSLNNPNELTLFDMSEITENTMKDTLTTQIEVLKNNEIALRSILSQQEIKVSEIENDFKEANKSIGTPEDVQNFVIECMKNYLGLSVTPINLKKDNRNDLFKISTINLNKIPSLSSYLPIKTELKICFKSPYPEGFYYIGRNHIFVEQLCQYMLSQSFSKNQKRNSPSRVSVIKSKDVTCDHVIFIFRVRNVIKEVESDNQLISEEVLITGYKKEGNEIIFLNPEEAENIIESVKPSTTLDFDTKKEFFEAVEKNIESLKDKFNEIALSRAVNLVEANERYIKTVKGSQYVVAEPVLPMDLIAEYIITAG